MKKRSSFIYVLLLAAATLVASLMPLACTTRLTSPVNPIATPTATASPVCAFTPISTVTGTASNGNVIIQNSTEWTAFYTGIGLLSPIPTPSVNFATQMVIAVSESYPAACTCNTSGPSITSVCAYSDHIVVNYQELPPPAACLQPTPIATVCAYHVTSQSNLAAVAQASPQVTWIYQPYLTPTPTP